MQDDKFRKTPVAADLESLAAQLSSLRDDMMTLTQSVATIAERRGRRMASDITDGVGEAMQYVERKGKSTEAELEKSIAAHPYVALGLAAATGLLIGMMSRR